MSIAKSLSFNTLCMITAGVCLTLCLSLVFAPDIIYWLFDLGASGAANVLSRRAGMLFAGFATLLLVSRNTASYEVRKTVTVTLLVSFLGLICAGLYEYSAGSVGPGIWIAIVGEVVLVVLFVISWFYGPTASKNSSGND